MVWLNLDLPIDYIKKFKFKKKLILSLVIILGTALAVLNFYKNKIRLKWISLS